MAYARLSAAGLDDTAKDGVESSDCLSGPADCGLKLLGRLIDFCRSILPFTLVQLGGTFISHLAWQLYPHAVDWSALPNLFQGRLSGFIYTFTCHTLFSETPHRSFAVVARCRYCKRCRLELVCLGLQPSIYESSCRLGGLIS